MTRRAPQGNRSPAGGASGVVYPISLCMIVRNEERFLRDALTSVQGVVDEICIVDSGSTDGTVAVAESFGAKVGFISWRDDFAWARNQALAMASGAWIFVLDADERLAPESVALLGALRHVKPDGQGRWIRCRNFSDAERGVVASTNAIIRIFPNDPGVRYRSAIHEYVARGDEEATIPATMTGIELLHYGYQPQIMTGRNKADRNFRVSRTAFNAAPDDAVHVYNYAMSALLAGEREIARTQFERVAELTRNTPRGFRPMAMATLSGMYVEAGLNDEALAAADECVAMVATFPDGHFARGRALAGLGRYEEARTALLRSIETGSRTEFEHFVVDDEIATWKAANEIGGTLVNEGRLPEALEWLERGLQARPAERVLMLNHAKCSEGLRKLNDALNAFRAIFRTFGEENAAIEYVNFVFRHGTPDNAVAAVEWTLPVLGEDYQRAFLVSAAAGMLRAERRPEATSLIGRALLVGGNPDVGRAIVKALGEQYGLPELNVLATGPSPASITVTGRVY
jgi:tetratricopeptide (TPR) repeat protein